MVIHYFFVVFWVIYALAMKWQVHTLLFIFGFPLESGVHALIEMLRNDETIISSISVTDIVFDVYLGKWNYRAIPK